MRKSSSRKKVKTQNFLVYVVISLLVIIFIGTIIGLIKGKDSKENLDKEDTPSEIRGDKALYSDLGQLRALTADEAPCTVIIYPVLEYNSKDKEFEEELVQKKAELRSMILTWFSQYKAHQLYSMSEVEVKKEILKSLNTILDLSKIEKIYFKDFVILE